jgi:poly(hydroxyalkanoate) depolymerase family esterase
MPGLGETTAMLARLRRQAGAFGDLAGGGERMVETQDFGANLGALRMLTYVPQDLAPGAPLVVVLHGCTQRAEAHARDGGWLTLADRYGFAVVAPEQAPANNANRCFNWFEPGDAKRGHGEAASIQAMVVHAVREHGLDADRVFVTGLSAGGAMTSVLLAAYPETFAAGAVVAGLPHGAAGNMHEALRIMHAGPSPKAGGPAKRPRRGGGRVPRVVIWHGEADVTVSPRNAHAIAEQWAAAHGLPSEASRTETVAERTRAVWLAPGSDEVLIESNLIGGLGHGTPLSTFGPDGVGAVAPYMIEAGVSSSLEIARFWGIADAAAARPVAPAAPVVSAPEPTPHQESTSHQESGGLGEQVMASLSQVPTDVQGVITKALKAAGLMK